MLKKRLGILIICSLTILVSCQGNKMEQKYRAVYIAINNCMDNGTADELDKYIATDAVDHQLDPAITSNTGLGGIKDVFKYYHNIFPDMKTTIHSMAVSGDTLFGYCTSVGTASQPFMGMSAGSQMTMNAVDVVVFKGDKMAEHWGFMDMGDVMKMMKQSAMMGQEEGMMEGEMGQ
jgi:predicted ester cyclase